VKIFGGIKWGIFKKSWYIVLIGFVIFVNLALIAYNVLVLRNKKHQYEKVLQAKESIVDSPNYPTIQSAFYNTPCPEITKYSINGEKIQLKNFAGNVIIIRFSRFYLQNLPELVYLQDLVEKYQNEGANLIFINSRGIHDQDGVGKIINLTFPIIEDDGTIRILLNAFPEDTIIIDRNFKIKYKNERSAKPIVHDEFLKWLEIKSPEPDSVPREELSSAIMDMSFYDVFKKEKRKVSQIKTDLIITVSDSICTGCEENSRIQLLREFAEKKSTKKSGILLIFGKGNNPEAIRQYSVSQEWDKVPFTVGVIEDSKDLDKEKYYKIFQLDIDPRTYIIDSSGKLVFVETRKNNKSFNYDKLDHLFR
jgi:peroxiredoxin